MAKLHFYYSAMNAGKSTTLLQSSHNYNERGMDTLLLIPQFAIRGSENQITTRIGLFADAIPIAKDTDIFAFVRHKLTENSNIRCVLVDEAQFLTKTQVSQLGLVTEELNTPVLAYGIRTDFRGEPFEGSLYLLAWADILIEIKTICHCGRKATMNLRVDAQGNAEVAGAQVEIAGNERYIAVCRKHFRLRQAKRRI
jgi:thymidine kinase